MSVLLGAVCRLGHPGIAPEDFGSPSLPGVLSELTAGGTTSPALSLSGSATPTAVPNAALVPPPVTPSPDENAGSHTSAVVDLEDEAARLLLSLKVLVTLLHLTSTTYVSASDSLLNSINEYAAKSDGEADQGERGGWALSMVARTIRRASSTDDKLAELLARLCLRMVEQIGAHVSDGGGSKDALGNVLAGGKLFRRYLIDSCQFGFEIRLAALGLPPGLDSEMAAATDGNGGEDDDPSMIEEAKRQGPGLVKFVGELFKMKLVPERVVHECLHALLQVGERGKQPAIHGLEDACALLTVVGRAVDAPERQAFVGAYIARLKSANDIPNLGWRTRSMLKTVCELRARGWVAAVDDAPPPRDNPYDRNEWQWKWRDADAIEDWRKKAPLSAPEGLLSGSGEWAHSRLRKVGPPRVTS
ncbi:ARM repeat-containing protein [Trametes cingulata]|nr:ARM repeat-containing protein [Trametes cingulata]